MEDERKEKSVTSSKADGLSYSGNACIIGRSERRRLGHNVMGGKNMWSLKIDTDLMAHKSVSV